MLVKNGKKNTETKCTISSVSYTAICLPQDQLWATARSQPHSLDVNANGISGLIRSSLGVSQ